MHLDGEVLLAGQAIADFLSDVDVLQGSQEQGATLFAEDIAWEVTAHPSEALVGPLDGTLGVGQENGVFGLAGNEREPGELGLLAAEGLDLAQQIPGQPGEAGDPRAPSRLRFLYFVPAHSEVSKTWLKRGTQRST